MSIISITLGEEKAKDAQAKGFLWEQIDCHQILELYRVEKRSDGLLVGPEDQRKTNESYIKINFNPKSKKRSKNSLCSPMEWVIWVILGAEINKLNRGWKMQRHRKGDCDTSSETCTQFQDGHEPQIKMPQTDDL